jgi:DNA-directed RNA polymerase specialized sigma24 family protein
VNDSSRPRETPRWQLDEGALRALLRTLDADPARAAREYERLRARLVRYFSLHGVPHALDATDEAFNRMARRLSEGEVVVNVEAYLAGIARLVMLEERRKLHRERAVLTRLVGPEGPYAPPPDEPLPPADALRAAFEAGLAELPQDARAMLTDYYNGGGSERMRARDAMARRLGLSIQSLRNRMLRLRQRLERAVQRKLDEEQRDVASGVDTNTQEDG